jgi:AhpD family alkylhydroperoxidase
MMIAKRWWMVLLALFLMTPAMVICQDIPQGRHELGYASGPPDFPVEGDVFDKRTMTVKKLGRHIDMFRDYTKQAKGADLDRAFAEKIMVTVAIENRCRHCYGAHILFAQNHGVSKEKINCLTDLPRECFEPDEYAALRYARKWAQGEGKIDDPEIISELENYYSEKEIAWINEMIVMMCLANRSANTFDAFLYRMKGKPRPKQDGGVGSELVMSSLFLMVGTPVYIQTQIIKARLEKANP